MNSEVAPSVWITWLVCLLLLNGIIVAGATLAGWDFEEIRPLLLMSGGGLIGALIPKPNALHLRRNGNGNGGSGHGRTMG